MAENRVVLYPSPGIGHLIAMVEFGKLLLTHNSSLSITILIPSFPFNRGSCSSYISSVSCAFPSISFHSLPYIPLSLGNDLSTYDYMEQIIFETHSNVNPYVAEFLQSLCLSSSSHVSAFILDLFCYTSLEKAQSLGIPTYFFFTTGASALAFFLNIPAFDRIATDSFRNLGKTEFEIPGLFPVRACDMMDSILDHGGTYDEVVKMGAYMAKSDGIVINTFESLEPRAVMALKEGTCLPGSSVPPIYCVGPLIANRGENGSGREEERNECLRWLDAQPCRSVVYLGFGSLGCFSEKQIREIAIGLERSEVRFLWVVRALPSQDKAKRFLPPTEPDLESLLPVGFLDRTKTKGLVVKSWAPQIDILAHEAVGGFVSHCGWNSTLEAINAGVPMVAWPLYAEQKFNRIVLVEEIKIALPMNASEDRFVRSDEIEKRVKQIINSDEGDAIRKRVSDLCYKVRNALGEGGSSRMAFATFVMSWKC